MEEEKKPIETENRNAKMEYAKLAQQIIEMKQQIGVIPSVSDDLFMDLLAIERKAETEAERGVNSARWLHDYEETKGMLERLMTEIVLGKQGEKEFRKKEGYKKPESRPAQRKVTRSEANKKPTEDETKHYERVVEPGIRRQLKEEGWSEAQIERHIAEDKRRMKK